MPSTRRKPGTPRRVTRTERWLNLLAFLLDRRSPVSRKQIFTEVEDYRSEWLRGTPQAHAAVRRKFERDKQELRTLGLAIDPLPRRLQVDESENEVEVYQLRARDLYLPYLELAPTSRAVAEGQHPYALPRISLKPEEFAVLRRAAERVRALGDTPLGASATSALRKLSFDLPGIAGPDDEVGLAQPVNPGFEKVFAALRQGVEERTRVKCHYYSIGRDQEEERVIEPCGLMLTWGHWYCIARAVEKDAMRVFRLDRMRSAELLPGASARFTVPTGFSIQHYLNRAPWELSDRPAVAAQVRVGFPHSRWLMAEGLGTVLEAVDPDGGALLEFQVRAADAFIRWLLPLGAQAEIVAPAELADALSAERRRLRAVYG